MDGKMDLHLYGLNPDCYYYYILRKILMKRFFSLLTLCALSMVSCEKDAGVLYTVAAEDITPCTVKFVTRVRHPEAFSCPLLIVWLSTDPSMKSATKLTSSEINDGTMSIPFYYLRPETTYYFKTRIIQDGINYDSPDFVFDTPDLPTGVIDMGVSVKWASTNLGADALNETGGLFAWGEVQPKTSFSWESYLWCDGSEETLTKYNEADGKLQLDTEDDAAHAIMGGNWRMPTSKEYRELLNNCIQSSHLTYKGTKGVTFTSRINGNTLFFPMRTAKTSTGTEYMTGNCWTSSLVEYHDPYSNLILKSGFAMEIKSSAYLNITSQERYKAAFIRPVLP